PGAGAVRGQRADLRLGVERRVGSRIDRDQHLGSQQPDQVLLAEAELNALPTALRHRVLARAVVELGGAQPSFERLRAAESLLRRQGSAGPVQMAGKVSAYRQARNSGPSYGKLVLKRLSQSQET
ncbi:MAG: TilS substrate-binding domain-containing protein, partial [Renibacterium salmoninarum]|nr:TilS substrate-binding domain-containing protein [Renibacterium salmoninarum]